MVKKIILKTKLPREKGKLYFCGTSSDGNLTIGEVKMARGKKKKKQVCYFKEANRKKGDKLVHPDFYKKYGYNPN